MIDYFALALTHGLLLVGLVRLLTHEQLDHEDVATLSETDAADVASAPSQDTVKPKHRTPRGKRS